MDFLVYLSGQDKIKPPTGSGRRERISVHHDELITGVDFFFSVHELLNVQSVLGVIVRGELVVGVLGQIVLVRKKRSDTTQLQNTLAAIQNRKLIYARKVFAKLLKILSVRWAVTSGVGGVVGVDSFFSQSLTS